MFLGITNRVTTFDSYNLAHCCTGFGFDITSQIFNAAMRKYETYTFSAAKFFADRGAEGVAQPLTERINVSTKSQSDDQGHPSRPD